MSLPVFPPQVQFSDQFSVACCDDAASWREVDPKGDAHVRHIRQ